MPASIVADSLAERLRRAGKQNAAVKLLVAKSSIQWLKPLRPNHHVCQGSPISKSSLHPLVARVAVFKPDQRVWTGPPVPKTSGRVLHALKSVAAGAAPWRDHFLTNSIQLMVTDRPTLCESFGTDLYIFARVCRSCLHTTIEVCPPASIRIGIDCPPWPPCPPALIRVGIDCPPAL